VEPTTPCVTNTTEEEKEINQQVISGSIIFSGRGSSSRSASLASRSQVSTLCGSGSSTNFTMGGQDPTIRLPYFRGDGSDDLIKNLFIYENMWETNQITDEDTKFALVGNHF
jgi:hypothetical protein